MPAAKLEAPGSASTQAPAAPAPQLPASSASTVAIAVEEPASAERAAIGVEPLRDEERAGEPRARSRGMRRVVVACVAAASALGALAAALSLRTAPAHVRARLEPAAVARKATGQSPVIPVTPRRAPPEVPQPPTDAPQPAAEAMAAEAPRTVSQSSNALGQDGSQRTAPSCVELIAAHAAPHYKVRPFDYIYLLELKTARRELVRGNLETAQAALCRALRDPSADSNVWFDLANVLLLRRDGAAAVPWLTKVLELDPKDRRARALLGDAFLQAGRVEEARAAWLQAAGLQSQGGAAIAKLAAGYFAMAEQSARRSDHPAAERLYRRAIALDPDHARARSRLADVLEKLGLTESAERWSATVE